MGPRENRFRLFWKSSPVAHGSPFSARTNENHPAAAAGLEPSAHIFGVLIKALVRKQRMDEAQVMFKEMQTQYAVRPTVVVCNTMLSGWSRQVRRSVVTALSRNISRWGRMLSPI